MHTNKSELAAPVSNIKSKERVRDLAEVYTNEREVKAMLDLIPLKHPDDIIKYRYLEPACGNGNFLIEILRRKLARVNEKYAHKNLRHYEFYLARALTTIYGIDICHENVQEARARLYTEVKSTFDMQKGSFMYSDGFLPLVRYILDTNIVQGDSINAPDRIKFTEFLVVGYQLEQRVFNFASLTEPNPQPTEKMPPKHFLLIGKEYELVKGIGDERVQGHFDFI